MPVVLLIPDLSRQVQEKIQAEEKDKCQCSIKQVLDSFRKLNLDIVLLLDKVLLILWKELCLF